MVCVGGTFRGYLVQPLTSAGNLPLNQVSAAAVPPALHIAAVLMECCCSHQHSLSKRLDMSNPVPASRQSCEPGFFSLLFLSGVSQCSSLGCRWSILACQPAPFPVVPHQRLLMLHLSVCWEGVGGSRWASSWQIQAGIRGKRFLEQFSAVVERQKLKMSPTLE